MTDKREPRQQPPPSRGKEAPGDQASEARRKSFLRELKRAARGRLDKRSPQD